MLSVAFSLKFIEINFCHFLSVYPMKETGVEKKCFVWHQQNN